jgi:hypothetical protein
MSLALATQPPSTRNTSMKGLWIQWNSVHSSFSGSPVFHLIQMAPKWKGKTLDSGEGAWFSVEVRRVSASRGRFAYWRKSMDHILTWWNNKCIAGHRYESMFALMTRLPSHRNISCSGRLDEFLNDIKGQKDLCWTCLMATFVLDLSHVHSKHIQVFDWK